MEKRIELERRARKAHQITNLNLDNCRSTSIVGLTDEYTALESLSLINVGLTTLKGFPKLPNLKKLELSDNRISNGLNYLHTSPKLEYLNLSGNKIKDLETLKPLEEFKHLAVLDLFNNEATQVDNYREKTFEMLPSLRYLDGFDCNDVEALSEGEDEEDYFKDSEDEGESDQQNAFNLNGLEIDLDELEAFEKRLKAKRKAAANKENHNKNKDNEDEEAENNSSNKDNNTTTTTEEQIDELDVYLQNLKLKEQQSQSQSSSLSQRQEESAIVSTCTSPTIDSKNLNLNFALLLYWFLAILNLASATFYSDEEGVVGAGNAEQDDDDDDDSDEDVSLSEVYNDDLEEDEDEWDEDNDDGNNDDDDFDTGDEDEANDSAVAADAVKAEGNADAAGADEESQARGKKRKHEG